MITDVDASFYVFYCFEMNIRISKIVVIEYLNILQIIEYSFEPSTMVTMVFMPKYAYTKMPKCQSKCAQKLQVANIVLVQQWRKKYITSCHVYF